MAMAAGGKIVAPGGRSLAQQWAIYKKLKEDNPKAIPEPPGRPPAWQAMRAAAKRCGRRRKGGTDIAVDCPACGLPWHVHEFSPDFTLPRRAPAPPPPAFGPQRSMVQRKPDFALSPAQARARRKDAPAPRPARRRVEKGSCDGLCGGASRADENGRGICDVCNREIMPF